MATQRVLLGNIRGPKGETGATGPTGPAGTISVGTVTKGEYGTPPQVTNSGSSTAATFDFVIPEGAPGDTVAAIDNLTLDEPTASTATLPIPASGERGKVIFGKIIKFFNDIKSLATTSANGLLRALSGNTSQWLRGDGSWQTAQNNDTTSAAGYVLDARMGKTLGDRIKTLNDSIFSNVGSGQTFTSIDDILITGIYSVRNSASGKPNSQIAQSVLIVSGIGSEVVQVLFGRDALANAAYQYIRFRVGGAWTAWTTFEDIAVKAEWTGANGFYGFQKGNDSTRGLFVNPTNNRLAVMVGGTAYYYTLTPYTP